MSRPRNMEVLRFTVTTLSLLIVCLPATPAEAYEVSIWLSAACNCHYTVYEQTRSLQVCAQIAIINGTMATVRDYNVTISTDDSSASTTDYFLAPTVVTFPAGSLLGARQCVTINITDDEIVENDELFYVSLSTDVAEVDLHYICHRASVIIRDSDVLTIELLETNRNVSENVGSFQICVNVTHGSVDSSVYAYYYTNDGTARNRGYYGTYYNYDFGRIYTRRLTFPRGDTVGTVRYITVTVIEDNIVESEIDEYFSLILRNGRRTTVSQGYTRISIRDNDVARIGMQTAEKSVNESTTQVSVCAVVTNSVVIGIPLSIRMISIPNTATGSAPLDYINLNQTATFGVGYGQGSLTSRGVCRNVTISEDNILEYDEDFSVVLVSEETNKLVIEPGRNITMITILEDEDSMTAGFQQTLYNAMETGGPQEICVLMFDGELERNVTLTVTSSDVSAIAPGDYSPLDTQVTFTVGQRAVDGSVVCTQLDVVDDDVVEVNEESLSLSLFPEEPDVTILASLAANVTFIIRENDNDVPGSVVLSSSTYDAYESDGSVEVCAVVQAAALERNIVIQLTSQDSTARNVEDYTSLQFVPLTFLSGVIFGTQLCHNVLINDDSILEGNETFSVTLSSREAIGTNMTQAVVSIRTDPADSVELGFLEDGYSISEQVSLRDEMICVVINSGTLEIEITVELVIQDITTDGADYTGPSPLVLMFSSGQTVGDQRCASVSALDDSLIEDDETLNITLSSPLSDSGAVRFTAGDETETLTILQDPNDRATVQLVNTTGSGHEGDDIIVCSELMDNGGGLSRPISLIMMITNGSANSGVDFNGTTSYPLTFPPNSSNGDIQCISISLFSDIITEVPENFVVELTTLDPAVMVARDADLAILTIVDVLDPNVLIVGLSSVLYSGIEGPNSTVSVCATILLGTANGNVSVLIVTPDSSSVNTATPLLDFIPIAETLTFVEGQNINDSVCADILIVKDVYVERLEFFEVLLLSNPENLFPAVVLEGRNRAFVTISDGEDDRDVSIQPSTPDVICNEAMGDGTISDQREPQVMVCIELAKGNLQRDVTVNIQTPSSPASTATANEDYIPLNQNVTFTSGQNATGDNQQCVFITLIDDDILEGTEIFVIIISALDNDDDVVNVTDEVITATLEEDPNDFVEVGLLPVNINVTENVTFPVCLEITNGTLGRNITVPLIVESGSAIEGVDFETPTPSSFTFGPGQSTGAVQCSYVTILDDPIPQDERNFTIRIGDGGEGGGTIGVRVNQILQSFVINIQLDLNDVIQVGLSEMIYRVTEGSMAQVSVCVNIKLGSLNSSATVALVTSTGGSSTATPGLDFIPISEVLTFTAGLSRGDSVCAPIMIIEDEFVEYQETFEVALFPTSEDFFKVLIVTGRDRSMVVISDGTTVVIMPTMTEIIATEGGGGDGGSSLMPFDSSSGSGQPESGSANEANFSNKVRGCIRLHVDAGNLQRDVTLRVMTLPAAFSPATVFEDYLPLDVNVTFTSGQSAAGDNEQCFNVTLLDDTVLEGNERFEILITPLPEDEDIVNITNQIITVLIEEDTEDNVRIGLTSSRFTVTESLDSAIMVCAELQEGILERNVTLFVDTTDNANNAVAGVDYQIELPSITFTAGQFGFDGVEQCFMVEILDDNDAENRESFEVTLRPADSDIGKVFISLMNSKVTVNVIEDPSDAVQLSPSSSVTMVTEGNDALVCIRVSLGPDYGSLQREVHVIFKTISDESTSATPGEDFVDVVTTVVVSSNEPVCTNITILNDDILEDCEAFFVGFEVVTNFSGIAIVPRDSDKAIVIIEDDLLDMATVGFDQSALEITEGDMNNETEVCVVASNVMERSVTVYLQIDNINSDATPGVDYQEVKRKELVFDHNVTSICTPVYVLDDSVFETIENIIFTLTPSLKDIAVVNFTNQHTIVRIYEDTIDGISIGLSQELYTVQENEGSVQVCAELLSGVLGSTLSLPVDADQDLDTSATKDVDYTGLPNNIVFESGQTTGAHSCINITIINNNFKEQKKYFNVNLMSDMAGVNILSTRTTIEITDTSTESEECPTVAITVLVAVVVFLILLLALLIVIIYLAQRRKKRPLKKDGAVTYSNTASVIDTNHNMLLADLSSLPAKPSHMPSESPELSKRKPGVTYI